MELNSDLIVNGGAGLAAGFCSGYVLKKVTGLLFKFLMVILTFFVFALVYLQSIRVININENALNNLLDSTYNSINNTVGPDALFNPAQYIVTNLGLPLTSGCVIGFIGGWSRA